VKNIGFTGVFRLIFKPLAEDFPGFGAVSYSLREKVSFILLLFKHLKIVTINILEGKKKYSEGNADFTYMNFFHARVHKLKCLFMKSHSESR
jgi:hypothetical protein